MSQQSKEHLIGAALFALLLLTALVYWPGLKGDLLLDDFDNLQPLQQLDNSFTSLSDVVFSNPSGPLGRPVAMLSFAANYIFDGNDTWSYKYTNLCIHLLCGLLVYWLTARLLALTSFRERRWELALVTAGLWLAAPLYVSTTLYVVQRMAQLSTLFTLAGLLCYVTGREHLNTRKTAGISLLAGCFLLFLPLAVFSKENGALLPLLALCIEIFFFGFKGEPHTRHIVAGVFIVSVAIPAVAALVFLSLKPAILIHGYAHRDFTLSERLLTEPRILFSYVGGLLFPNGPNMGLFHDDYPISSGLLSPPTTLLAIIGWCLLLSIPFVLRKKAVMWLGFGPVFFLAGHSLESTVYPLELYFEHRNYLPGYGIFFSLTIAAGYLYSYFRSSSSAIVILASLLVAYNVADYQRVKTWSSWETIILSDATHHPNSSRLQTELATYYANHQQLESALTHLHRALVLRPSSWSGVAVHRLDAYCTVGAPIPPAAYAALSSGTRLGTGGYTINALAVLRGMIDNKSCPQLDIPSLIKAVKAWLNNPRYQPTLNNRWRLQLELGQIQYLAGHPVEAVNALKQAFDLRPKKLESGLLAIKYQIASGDLDGAAKMLDILKKRNDGKRRDYTLSIQVYSSILRKIHHHAGTAVAHS